MNMALHLKTKPATPLKPVRQISQDMTRPSISSVPTTVNLKTVRTKPAPPPKPVNRQISQDMPLNSNTKPTKPPKPSRPPPNKLDSPTNRPFPVRQPHDEQLTRRRSEGNNKVPWTPLQSSQQPINKSQPPTRVLDVDNPELFILRLQKENPPEYARMRSADSYLDNERPSTYTTLLPKGLERNRPKVQRRSVPKLSSESDDNSTCNPSAMRDEANRATENDYVTATAIEAFEPAYKLNTTPTKRVVETTAGSYMYSVARASFDANDPECETTTPTYGEVTDTTTEPTYSETDCPIDPNEPMYEDNNFSAPNGHHAVETTRNAYSTARRASYYANDSVTFEQTSEPTYSETDTDTCTTTAPVSEPMYVVTKFSTPKFTNPKVDTEAPTTNSYSTARAPTINRVNDACATTEPTYCEPYTHTTAPTKPTSEPTYCEPDTTTTELISEPSYSEHDTTTPPTTTTPPKTEALYEYSNKFCMSNATTPTKQDHVESSAPARRESFYENETTTTCTTTEPTSEPTYGETDECATTTTTTTEPISEPMYAATQFSTPAPTPTSNTNSPANTTPNTYTYCTATVGDTDTVSQPYSSARSAVPLRRGKSNTETGDGTIASKLSTTSLSSLSHAPPTPTPTPTKIGAAPMNTYDFAADDDNNDDSTVDESPYILPYTWNKEKPNVSKGSNGSNVSNVQSNISNVQSNGQSNGQSTRRAPVYEVPVAPKKETITIEKRPLPAFPVEPDSRKPGTRRTSYTPPFVPILPPRPTSMLG